MSDGSNLRALTGRQKAWLISRGFASRDKLEVSTECGLPPGFSVKGSEITEDSTGKSFILVGDQFTDFVPEEWPEFVDPEELPAADQVMADPSMAEEPAAEEPKVEKPMFIDVS